MKTVAIIPARYKSSRFPGKPLAQIGSKTMIQRVYERAKMVPELSEVIVATDDQRIIDNIIAINGKAVMTASTHKNGTERCVEVLEHLDKQPEIVLNIQGDVPFIELSHIQQVINSFKIKETQIATLCMPIHHPEVIHNPDSPKVVFDQNHNALYFSRSPIPYLRDLNKKEWPASFPFYKHIGIYGFRNEVIRALVKLPEGKLEKAEHLEQLRWLENGYRIHLSETEIESPAIDTPEDLANLLNTMEKENLQ